jgi:hypothetical protein
VFVREALKQAVFSITACLLRRGWSGVAKVDLS